MKKNVAVVLSATGNLAFAVGNVLVGLERHSPGFADDVIIFQREMDAVDITALQRVRPCRILEYERTLLDRQTETDNIKKYSLLAFAVYEIFGLLASYRHVVYLDCDILIQRDIRDILQFGPVAMGGGRLTIHEALGARVDGIPSDLVARSSGVVVINDALPNYRDLTGDCYQQTAKYWSTLAFPDQAVVNLVLASRGIPIAHLPASYNHGRTHRKSYDAHIVHTQGGKSKFWNNGVSAIMFPEWRRNNDRWLALGGRPFDGRRYYWKLANSSIADLYALVKAANDAGLYPPTR